MQTQGRILARCVDMYVSPAAVIYVGTGYSHPGLVIQDDEIPRLQRAWAELLRLDPTLENSLQGLDQQGYWNVVTGMTKTFHRAVSDDASTIKTALVDSWLAAELRAANVNLDSRYRVQRGFNNPVTGRYLCPISLDYGDEIVQRHLAYSTYRCIPLGEQTFMFDMKEYDPADPCKTFLRGPLIVSAWIRIFDHHQSHARPHQPHLRVSIARSYGMEGEVTLGSIIYAAVMVYFALSSTGNLSTKPSAYRDLFDELLKFVNEPVLADDIEKLLQWWNKVQSYNPRNGCMVHSLFLGVLSLAMFRGILLEFRAVTSSLQLGAWLVRLEDYWRS